VCRPFLGEPLENFWKFPRSLVLKFVTTVLRGHPIGDGCFYTHEAPTILEVLYVITEPAQQTEMGTQVHPFLFFPSTDNQESMYSGLYVAMNPVASS